ncbi:MAG: hypothetical protein LBU51_07220 [Bacteroidales bacterium]|jgi:hypothetical protein|nr:hypothetical protein [Bacteroidales bacterium]
MKFLSILLSVFILSLSATPCCFAVDNHAEKEPVDVQFHQENSSKDDCAGDCSPFCLCTTCAGFTVEVVSSNVIAEVQSFCFDLPVFYQQPYAVSLSNTIWQPLVVINKSNSSFIINNFI